MLYLTFTPTLSSGGSRILRWGGRRAVRGGANLQRRYSSAKMYAKTKELDPVGGARAGGAPPRSANVKHNHLGKLCASCTLVQHVPACSEDILFTINEVHGLDFICSCLSSLEIRNFIRSYA